MTDVTSDQKNDNNNDCYFCRFLVSCRLKMRFGIAISYSSYSIFGPLHYAAFLFQTDRVVTLYRL